MQRPIIIGVRGEARDIVMEAHAGIAMEPDSARSLVEAVETLADNPGATRDMGKFARQFVAAYYDRNLLAGRIFACWRPWPERLRWHKPKSVSCGSTFQRGPRGLLPRIGPSEARTP